MIYLIFNIYNLLTNLITFIIYLLNLIIRNDSINNRLLVNGDTLPKNKQNIWIHAASVGEVLSTKALVIALKEKYDCNVVITTQTATSKHIIETSFKGLAIHCYSPYDCSFLANKFIKKYQPSLVLWIEQEFLPSSLYSICKKHIPLVLLNGRISQKSFKLWKKVPNLAKFILSCFTNIFASSLEDQNRLTQLAKKPVQYIGNLKVTNTALQGDEDFSSKLKNITANYPVFLALSTHNDEEDIIISTHLKLSKTISNLKTIILPRHINNCASIKQYAIKHYGINIPLLSEVFSTNSLNSSIILADTIGNTVDLCNQAYFVFIGKSLSKLHQGGHNLIEPLVLGKPVIFGSNMQNFQDLADTCLKHKAGFQVNSSNELYETIYNLLQNDNLLQDTINNTKYIIKDGNDILKKTMTEIQPYLT